MTPLTLSPGWLTTLVIVVLLVAVVVGWRSFRTQLRRIQRLPEEETPVPGAAPSPASPSEDDQAVSGPSK